MKEKLKSIADIARIAGVSKSTVSRALNDSPLARTETKAKIQAIAKRYDFQPSVAARNLSLHSSRTIAFVSHAYSKLDCGISDFFSLEIMGGIATGLHELGYDLMVVLVNPDDKEWAGQLLDSGRVDGFILMTSTKKTAHIDMLLKKNAPFVAWGTSPGKYCTVCGDDYTGGMLATQRLLPRSRIAFICGPSYEGEAKERYRGYEAALREAGRAVDPSLVVEADYSEAGGTQAMETLLARDLKIDAVFATGDLMAIAAMRVLKTHGRRIPDDVAVVGYDDRMLAGYVTPGLTTISQKIPLAGKLLARDLIAYLKQGIITTTVMPVELIVRESA